MQKSILSKEEVYFFYYDVMRNGEDSIQFAYDWNNDIQNYLDSKGIVMEARKIYQEKHGRSKQKC